MTILSFEEKSVVMGTVLGSGSFGRVFEAMVDGQLVAAKAVIKRTETIVKKTKIEITALKSWTSSGFTPKFYGSVDMVNVVRIFMELMGPSLRDVLDRNKTTGQFFSTSDILEIGNQICQGLSYLNCMGYVHGDIKTRNVCLSRDDPFKVKLVDLGEVCRIDELNIEARRCGTWSYSSPQALHGLPLDEKLDIWSVGCLLSELRLGEKLFPGKDAKVYRLHSQWGLGLPSGTSGAFTSILENKKCDMTTDANRHPTMLGHICKGHNISTLDVEEQRLIKYIMSMLQFCPENRPPAAELCK